MSCRNPWKRLASSASVQDSCGCSLQATAAASPPEVEDVPEPEPGNDTVETSSEAGLLKGKPAWAGGGGGGEPVNPVNLRL